MSSQDYLSVEQYVSPTTLEPYWKQGNWKQCPIGDHYTGEAGLILLQKMGVDSSKAEQTLFDIGAGAGLITSLVYDHSKGVNVISLDSDPGMISEIKRKRVLGDWSGWKGITADFYMNGLGDGSVDYIAAHYFFFYLAKDYPRALKECQRLLKPGGLIGWTAPSYAYPLEDIVKVIQTLPSPPPGADQFPPAMPDVGCNTIEGSRALLEGNGFKAVHVEEVETFASFTSPRQAAESCAPVLLNWVENWPEASVQEVMLGLEGLYEAEFEGGKGTRRNKVVIAVGEKV